MPEDTTTPDPEETPAAAGFEILRLPAPDPDAPPAERVPLFTIGDREYTMLASPPFRVGVEYLYQVRHNGIASALDFLLDEMLGVEAFAALRAYEGLKDEQLAQVITIVHRTAMGRVEVPKAASTE
jgi:hypothetical protein